MNPPTLNLDALPLDIEEQIDRICLRFEQAWQSQPCPTLRPYLAEVPEPWQPALLHEILCLELEYRGLNGDAPRLEEYLSDYPEWAEQLRLAFPPSRQESSAARDLSNAATTRRPPGMPGQVGNYRILRELGRGGMGVVYEAVQAPLGRRVALKVLAPKVSTGTEVERFRREAEVASRLHHTNIVPIFEAGQDGDVCFYAMQYIEGLDLHRFLADVRRIRGPMNAPAAPYPAAGAILPTTVVVARRRGSAKAQDDTEEETPAPPMVEQLPLEESPGCPWPEDDLAGHAYFRRVAEIGAGGAVLAYAHDQGAIHRDIKPTNFLLDGRGTVWVTDFGLVKTGDSELTSSGAVVGTLRYLAPERLRGACDARSDIYSLGLTLYELATLHPAFSDADQLLLLEAIAKHEPLSPRRLDPHVPRDLETIILKAIDKAPDRRYPRADDLAEDLRRFLAGRPILARRTGPVELAWIWGKRHPLPALAIALFVLALVFVAGASLWTAHQAVRNEEKTKEVLDEVKQERDAKELALRRAQGLRLIAQSETVRAENPTLALLLAIEGAQRSPGLLANNAMQEALDQCREHQMLTGHRRSVFSASFSDDGKKVLSCSEDGTARLWDVATGKQLHVLEEPNLVRASISPDGRRVVTLSGNEVFRRFLAGAIRWHHRDWEPNGPAVRLWDAETGRLLARWQPPKPSSAYWLLCNASAAFSADSRQVVTFFSITPEGHPLVHDAETGKQVAVLTGHTPVLAAAFSPDNRMIATSSGDNAIRLWEATTGRLLHTMPGHQSGVMSVRFSPDGGRLLTHGMGWKYLPPDKDRLEVVYTPDAAAGRVWDTKRGMQLAALAWPDLDRDPFLAGEFHPDARYVVLANGQQGPRLWNARTGNPEPTLVPNRLELPRRLNFGDVALARDGSTSLYSGLDRTPRVLAGGEVVALRGHEDTVNQANLSSDGKRVVTASADGSVRLWVAPDPGIPNLASSHAWATPFVTLSPDSRRLFVRQLRAPKGQLIDTSTGRTLVQFDAFPSAAVFSRGGQEIVVLSPGGNNPNEKSTAQLLDASTGKVLATVNDVPGRLLALSPDKRLALVVRHDATKGNGTGEIASLWDFHSRAKVADLKGLTQRVEEACFSPDGRRVLTGSSERYRHVHVFDTATGDELTSLRTRGPYFWWAAFVAGGKQIVGFHIDVPFRLWEAETGTEVRGFTNQTLQPGHLRGWNFPPTRLRLLQLSPAGTHFVCPSYVNTTEAPTNVVGVWDVAKGGEPTLVLKGHGGEVTLSRYSADGRHILTGAEDRTARLWDAATGQERAVFRGHKAAVTCGELDRTGELLVTGSLDRTIRVWNVSGGKELARLRWPHGPIEEVAFTADGRRVVIRGKVVTRLWDLDILTVARGRVPRSLTVAEREHYEIPASQ